MYNDNLIIKLPEAMKKEIKKKAESNCQTVSDYIRSLILKDFRENK